MNDMDRSLALLGALLESMPPARAARFMDAAFPCNGWGQVAAELEKGTALSDLLDRDDLRAAERDGALPAALQALSPLDPETVSRKEQLRQWALLGLLLEEMPVPRALRLMVTVFHFNPWAELLHAAGRGEALSGALAGVPEEIAAAVRSGEADGSLPARLSALAFPAHDGSPRSALDDPEMFWIGSTDGFITRVNEILLEASRAGFARLRLGPPQAECVPVVGWREAGWLPLTELSPEEWQGVRRRLLVMARLPYWKREARSASFRSEFPGPTTGTLTETADGALSLELRGRA
jgi:hypothetical protein